MLFFLSKLFWLIFKPSHLLLLVLLAGVLFSFSGRRSLRRFGRWLTATIAFALLIIAVLPVGSWLIYPLESRFEPPADLPAHIDGIIVLGGGISTAASAERGEAVLNDSAERLTALLELARRYPGARLVYSSGARSQIDPDVSEADIAAEFFAARGLAPGRLLLERDSANTAGNVFFSQRLTNPKPGEKWVLITSAFHMPRAIAVFRRAKWAVIPYPVDWRGRADSRLLQVPDLWSELDRIDAASKEYVGLIAYWLFDYGAEIFPKDERRE